MRRELERIEIPGEHEARERAWGVVAGAFAEREPQPRSRSWKPAAALALAAVALAGLLSPPGRAVLDEIREVVGVERADPALFSLPTKGRLLVTADSGVWVVDRDGSKRLLGRFEAASWSPLGKYVVAARRHELLALEPDGDVRWTLARPAPERPSWGGNRSDTRIAYLSGNTLRVVAGDGTGDRVVATGAARVGAVWMPRAPYALTYARRDGSVITISLQTGRELWRTARGGRVEQLQWSTDGRRLLVLRRGAVEVRDRTGSLFTGIRLPNGSVAAASFRPGSHAVAYVMFQGDRSRVALLDEPSRTLLTVPGRIEHLAWSPDGSTVLVPWLEADQWLFIPRRAGTLRAVDDISAQFGGFPRTVSWCCAD